jgi:hypothetical protein
MATKRREFPSVHPPDRAHWRAWLTANRIGSAKRPETRAARIQQVLAWAAAKFRQK